MMGDGEIDGYVVVIVITTSVEVSPPRMTLLEVPPPSQCSHRREYLALWNTQPPLWYRTTLQPSSSSPSSPSPSSSSLGGGGGGDWEYKPHWPPHLDRTTTTVPLSISSGS